MTWILKDYDINKDIKIGNVIQLPVADIRIPVAEKEFSTYLKIIMDKAYYRIENPSHQMNK
jgi:hypothetical protein